MKESKATLKVKTPLILNKTSSQIGGICSSFSLQWIPSICAKHIYIYIYIIKLKIGNHLMKAHLFIVRAKKLKVDNKWPQNLSI